MRSPEEQSQRKAEEAVCTLRSRLQRELALQVGCLRLEAQGWSLLLGFSVAGDSLHVSGMINSEGRRVCTTCLNIIGRR